METEANDEWLETVGGLGMTFSGAYYRSFQYIPSEPIRLSEFLLISGCDHILSTLDKHLRGKCVNVRMWMVGQAGCVDVIFTNNSNVHTFPFFVAKVSLPSCSL